MKDEYRTIDEQQVKLCPDLVGWEENESILIGGPKVRVPVLHSCVLSNCVAYDPIENMCKKYGNTIYYE